MSAGAPGGGGTGGEAAAGEVAVRVQGLVKRYGERAVLEGVDLVVRRGTILGYVGPNGAGKTTTMRILSGLDESWSGSVAVCGFDPREEPLEVKRRIGFVPENAHVWDSLTVAEHLLFVGRVHGLADELVRRRGQAALEAFGIAERLGSRLGALSKGMRQKVLLTSALLHDPEVLLVDEPLSGLDVHAAILVKELLRGLAERGRAVVYCSHVMDVVQRVCDEIAILDQGRIVARGSWAELERTLPGGSLEGIFARLTGSGDEEGRARRLLDALS